jgi:cytidylate kinase
VSGVATLGDLRARLVEKQRAFARGRNVVADGRDMGTVVFPEADLKFYLEDVLGRRVDLVTRKGLRPRLRPSVEAEAIRVA